MKAKEVKGRLPEADTSFLMTNMAKDSVSQIHGHEQSMHSTSSLHVNPFNLIISMCFFFLV